MSKRHIILTSLLFHLTFPNYAYSSPMLSAQKVAYKHTEQWLIACSQKQYRIAWQMLHPSLQKKLPLNLFKNQFAHTFKVIGRYKKGSLRYISKWTIQGATRWLWKAEFTQDTARIAILQGKSGSVLGLTIQSPKWIQAQRNERPVVLTNQQRKTLEHILKTLMQGYNNNQYALFCKYCAPLMSKVYTQSQFKTLKKTLWQLFGVYHSHRFIHMRTVPFVPNTFVVRFWAHFSKRKKTVIQLVVRPYKTGYRTLSWKLKRTL